jgi:DNA mismatch repair protein MutL
MNRIHVLPEQVANQIAAGEVIERPASVVKELVENALDAQATQIDVRVQNGGRSLVSVTDNGWGMSRDDALLCLERHATSKIKSSRDLKSITSFGFRGEAIPSIASVSRFRLRTREINALGGTEIVINGGKLESVKETGLATGTQIEVRSLFYNLPARRKFLRSEPTETAHIKQQLILAGLSRPDTGFSVAFDNNPPQRWPARQTLFDRICAIHGKEYGALLVPVEAREGDLSLTGFVGRAGVSRANRAEELVFVNQRPVTNRTLQFALLEGFHNALMRGRYPVAFLFLEIDPADVDVNIHPAKREVRFHNDARVRQFVVAAVKEALATQSAEPVPVSLQENRPRPTPTVLSLPAQRPVAAVDSETFSLLHEAVTTRQHNAQDALDLKLGASPVAENQTDVFATAPAGHPYRVLGCVASLYIVAESADGLVLIDQHAAHERILFEQMLRRLDRQEVVSQRLLMPATVNLPPRESDFLQAQIPALQGIGLGISLFGPHTFLVDALPPMVKTTDVESFIRTLVVELQEAGGETRKSRRLSEETVAKTVCRHAVKANDPLKPGEWNRLIADLLACDLPATCPHGRPTMILFSRAELEKKFGRAV